jgi:replication-associated recombination protein RarA
MEVGMATRREFPWPTVLGYDLYEVMSAMQKSIRRGLEEDALFWGTELYLSDLADQAWSRLLVISSEDVGLASLVGPTLRRLTTCIVATRSLGNLASTLSMQPCCWLVHRNRGA